MCRPSRYIISVWRLDFRRRAGRGDFLKVEDDDPRRPEIKLRRLVQRRIFADRIVDIALEHARDRFRRRLDLQLRKHVLDLFGAGRRDQVLEHRHGVALRDLGQTELLDLAERGDDIAPNRIRAFELDVIFDYRGVDQGFYRRRFASNAWAHRPGTSVQRR